MSSSQPSTSVASAAPGTSGPIPQSSAKTRRQTFRALHERGCFVMPNPWDVGSARYLQSLGFPAVATTSAGFAFSQGLPDSDAALSRDLNLGYITAIAAAVDLPVNADFAAGYGKTPQDVFESVMRCVDTGIAGLSIEDATGDPSSPLHALPVGFMHAARTLKSEGRFAALTNLVPYADMNALFATDRPVHQTHARTRP